MKAQASLEFIAVMSMAILILISGMAVTTNYLDIILKSEEINTAEDLVAFLKNEVNLAARVENGYVRTLKLPTLINNQDYIVFFYDREVSVSFSDECEFIPPAFTILDCERDFAVTFATSISYFDSDPSPLNRLIIIGGSNMEISKIDNVVTVREI